MKAALAAAVTHLLVEH